MEKKYITELNVEGLTKVFHANEELQCNVQVDMEETEMFYIGEQLDYFKKSLRDWSFGPYNHNYLRVSDYDAFIAEVETMEEEVPLLVDDDLPILQAAVEARDTYREESYDSEEFEAREIAMEEAGEELENLVVKRFTERLDGCRNKEYQLNYFLEFYAENRLDVSCYIQEEGSDYILYEDISYTKSFK